MSLDEAIRDAVRAALVSELPAALAGLVEQSRLVPLREAGVSYRLLLSAEHAGELRIYRRGHSAFVERTELERWVLAAPAARATSTPAPRDEVGELLEIGDRRRKSRKGRAA
ncbi:MAG: hypothetical protein ABI548_04610 [Polyangiaceae bacterium]